MAEFINLDHNSGAPLDPRVATVMAELPPEADGNPSSGHALGRAARGLLEDARERVAAQLRVQPEEILFCSGGTEANNLALRGGFEALGLAESGELWLSPIEHPSVALVGEQLAQQAALVRRLRCNDEGHVLAPADSEGEGPALLSLTAACGETGVLQPVSLFAEALRARAGLLHVDASQALGRVELDFLDALDFATFSPHKSFGPRGIAVLLRREGRPLRPLLLGGGQEQDLRPGTEPVRLAQGAARCFELAMEQRAHRAARMTAALEALLAELRQLGAEPFLSERPRLPNTATVCFPGVAARLLMPALDSLGICVSFGTACRSGAREPSPALRALGLDEEAAKSALRISVGEEISPALAGFAAARFRQALGRVRAISSRTSTR